MRNDAGRRGASRARAVETPNNNVLLIVLATLTVLTLLAAGMAKATDFYVSPGGTTSTASGTGTSSSPWSLQTALSQPSAVHAGDTIWLAGGTYPGTYTSSLTGSASAPIVVRAMPGVRATIDGGNSGGNAILVVSGAYTWYWGFEIMSSDPLRQSSQDGSWPTDIGRGEGVQIMQTGTSGTGTKFINLVVHDTRQGFSWWIPAQDSEISGCLSYYNGWQGATDRGHGHGAYIQNQVGTKLVSDSIIFRNFSHGLHAYGSDTSHLDNIQYVGNTAFSNGEIGGAYVRNFLTGGGVVAQSPVWDANMTWAPWGNEINGLGYAAGCGNAKVTNNYLVGASKAIDLVACTTGLSMTGNSFIAMYNPDSFNPGSYPSNTYTTSQPSGVNVFVRKNKYEAGRANITIYGWDGRASTSVDVSSVLSVGATYEVRDAQNFFGRAVASGTYQGGAITLPLSNLTPAAPVGMSAPPATGPQFNAFVLLTTSGGGGGTGGGGTGGGGGGTGTPPTATFSNSPSWATTGQTVTFTDQSTGSPTSWAWVFGDGATSSAQNPTHVYGTAGTYTVRLTVTNASGSSYATQTQTIAAGTTSGGNGFYPIGPCRLVDSRKTGGSLAAGARRNVMAVGSCAIPSGATSLAANVTATNPKSAGQLVAFPGDSATVPLTTTVAFRASQTRASNTQLKMGADGTVAVSNGSAGSVDFIIDVAGYYK